PGGSVDAWVWLLDILILLGVSMVLGTLAEQLKQSAIIGYILAGMLVGPKVLGLVGTGREVDFIAELGVTLLLFSIGLEFSFRRLVRMGPITFVGGTVQVLLTAAAAGLIFQLLGLGWRTSAALGMMAALSSTACVVRVLTDTSRIDSLFGRNAIGILLLQDIALVPLVLLTVALGGNSSIPESLLVLARTIGLGLLIIGGFYLLLVYLVPRLLKSGGMFKNRDLPVLLAIVLALGAAWAFHSAGLSPSLGAFIAGLLLAESPFAVQIRADVAPLRTLLVTLFFAAIGLLVDPLWVARHAVLVGAAAGAVIVLKPLIIWGIVRAFGYGPGVSLATGVCLGQVGEFSFMLANLAEAGGVIDGHLFRTVVAAAVVTLLATPYLVRTAPGLARLAETGLSLRALRRRFASGTGAVEDQEPEAGCTRVKTPVLILGFGPAGQRVAEVLLPHYGPYLVVLDLNPKNADWAESLGLEFHHGDACRREVLEHLQIRCALAVVITIPDPGECRQIIHLCRSLAPGAVILARARYHIRKWEFVVAGANIVVDEEDRVGEGLAEGLLQELAKKGLPEPPEAGTGQG
ncbi:MAG: cation:proton antiporter, partial [Candidatus Glassbacteria bacterium]|nr:cation:proton antiporter [Candidatus Glassbacteria bacterium]